MDTLCWVGIGLAAWIVFGFLLGIAIGHVIDRMGK